MTDIAVYDPNRLPTRIRSKFEIAANGCWEWTACRSSRGYGKVSDRGAARLAHRVVYQMLVGEIPSGLEPDHLCRVPRCVNPAHLELVTHAENVLRGNGFAGSNSRKTHCPQGHEYTPENTYLTRQSGGRKHLIGRRCKTCHIASVTRRRLEGKAA